MHEFIIRYLEDGSSNAVFRYARLFNDGMVTLPTCLDDLRVFNFYH